MKYIRASEIIEGDSIIWSIEMPTGSHPRTTLICMSIDAAEETEDECIVIKGDIEASPNYNWIHSKEYFKSHPYYLHKDTWVIKV